jgi:hypothetical protein
LQGHYPNDQFEVKFEEDFPDLFLVFVQNRGKAFDDRYYLDWITAEAGERQIDAETGIEVVLYNGVIYAIDTATGHWLVHPATGRRIIRYNNDIYTVNYTGKKEPFLRYRFIGGETIDARRMRGYR